MPIVSDFMECATLYSSILGKAQRKKELKKACNAGRRIESPLMAIPTVEQDRKVESTRFLPGKKGYYRLHDYLSHYESLSSLF